eukprot:1993255-Rhodomonas_salina.1
MRAWGGARPDAAVKGVDAAIYGGNAPIQDDRRAKVHSVELTHLLWAGARRLLATSVDVDVTIVTESEVLPKYEESSSETVQSSSETVQSSSET